MTLQLTGRRFGKLVVIRATTKRKRRYIQWECTCDCGASKTVISSELLHGHTKSCGCLCREETGKRFRTHGKSRSKAYWVWNSMIQRCQNKNRESYKYWGGLGVKVCKRWHTFENFLEDMGKPPPGRSLDRWPNNDGDYEPSNCRWATASEQRRNQRGYVEPKSVLCGCGCGELTKPGRSYRHGHNRRDLFKAIIGGEVKL